MKTHQYYMIVALLASIAAESSQHPLMWRIMALIGFLMSCVAIVIDRDK